MSLSKSEAKEHLSTLKKVHNALGELIDEITEAIEDGNVSTSEWASMGRNALAQIFTVGPSILAFIRDVKDND